MSPRVGRVLVSATWARVSRDHSVEVVAELVQIDGGGVAEQRHCSVGANEAVSAEGGQLAHRNAIAGHDERLALVELPHDLPAVVPQFPLGDLPTHVTIVARRATGCVRRLKGTSRCLRVSAERARIGLRIGTPTQRRVGVLGDCEPASPHSQ